MEWNGMWNKNKFMEWIEMEWKLIKLCGMEWK
jgi:hypothetical protein